MKMLLVSTTALFLFFSCAQTQNKSDRQTANEADMTYQPEVATKSNQQEVAENLICRPAPTVPASAHELIIKVHLDQPIAHLAEVLVAGDTKSTGHVSVYTKSVGQEAQLQYSAPTRFAKEPTAFSSELRGSMAIPGAIEAGWIHIVPNMKKGYFGFGGYKYSGGYKGAVYLSKLGQSWYQTESLNCEVK